ncbi:RNA polymerase sigma factor [Streptomyces eurythermus]|uniref:RNA polymerase sigma factor n=1 Tax=Streptomyces eurythermus TaxID=42237 RepID=UPI0036FE582A
MTRPTNLRAGQWVPALTDHDEPLADRAADRVVARAVRREPAAALAALPARHRDVLLLVAWGGLGYEETAEALGIPVDTVRARPHRARSKLREALGGSDPTALREVSEHE